MTRARKELISIEDTSYYHCIVKCVRGAFLCGSDTDSGKNFDHRKKWIVDRIKVLSEIFAIDVCAYAVMSNHYHLVLHVDTETSNCWKDEEVVSRWKKLFSGNHLVDSYINNSDLSDIEIENATNIIETWKDRLASISWFMRCMNESIARRANKEEECKGRFWDGRFKSQALLDETAVLSCMVYVDLNPIRAGICESLEMSEFTSIQERIKAFNKTKNSINKNEKSKQQNLSKDNKNRQPKTLKPFSYLGINSRVKASEQQPINFSLIDYFELLDWTGRALRDDKKGVIPEHITPILIKLGVNEKNWIKSTQHFGNGFFTIAGSVEKLQNFAKKLKNKWKKGVGISRALYAVDNFLLLEECIPVYSCASSRKIKIIHKTTKTPHEPTNESPTQLEFAF